MSHLVHPLVLLIGNGHQKRTTAEEREEKKMSEDFFGNLTIDPDYFLILNLDSVENIAHPFWEFLDPSPDIHQLFNRFNKLFFDGIFTDEQRKVTLQWYEKRGPVAAQTWPGSKKKPIRIEMNKKLLNPVLRKEVIETLLHEMIHAYLIALDLESDENDHHCENFERKRKEINARANLNITVLHNFLYSKDRYIWRCRRKCRLMGPFFGFAFMDKEDRMPTYKTHMVIPQGTCVHAFERCTPGSDAKLAVSKWDCIRYFVTETKNFARIKTSHEISQNPEAAKEFVFEHSMQNENSFAFENIPDDANIHGVIDRTVCGGPSESGYLIHDYITQRSPSQGYNSSSSADDDCIDSANGDDDSSCSTDDNDCFESINGNENPFCSKYNNDCADSANGDDDSTCSTDNNVCFELLNGDENPYQAMDKLFLEDKFFGNYDKIKKTLANIDNSLNTKFAKNLERLEYLYVCMICCEPIDDDKATIVEHLENCTALTFALPPEENDDQLPIYKLTSSV